VVENGDSYNSNLTENHMWQSNVTNTNDLEGPEGHFCCLKPSYLPYLGKCSICHHQHTTTVLRPFLQDHPGEPVPEENFWTSWCKARLTEADTLTIWLGTTPSGLTSAHLHHPPPFFMGQMPFVPPNQQCQSTEGN